MAVLASYSRHKMLDELNEPLYSATKGGDTYFLTSDEQRATLLGNVMGADALPTGAAITTAATTTLASHYKISPISGIIKLTLTDFAVGTSADGASLGIGASLISFPTETWVAGRYVSGTFTLADDGQTTAIECGLGTTVASGAVAVLGGTATFESVLGGSATSAFSDAGTTSTGTFLGPAASSLSGTTNGTVLRTTTPGLAVFFNVAGAWDAGLDAAAALTFSGTVALEYMYMA